MKLIWSTAALAVFLFLHAPGCTHGSLTEAEEASIITNVAVVFSRAARMRSRRIQAKWEQHPELCASYRNQGRSALSACWASAGEMTGVANHMGELCSRHDQVVNVTYDERRESCLLDDGCQWDAPPGKRKKHRCHAYPCFRINNGKCTLQATNGRCVWWSQGNNKKFRGIDAPGCYQSPCSNPLDNSPRGCRKQNKLMPFKLRDSTNSSLAEPSPYTCTWCRGGTGCMNRFSTSEAQCFNIGSRNSCSNCNTEMGVACQSDKCAANCCDPLNPYCGCSARTAESTGINVLAG